MRGGLQFQSLGVLMVATVAAAGFYGVSHTVATERQALADARRDIRATRADIRTLQTELGTRASLRQLERWNAEVMGLGTPGPDQFVTDARALATLDRSGIAAGVDAGPPMLVQAQRMPERVPERLADAGGAVAASPTRAVASDVSVAQAVTDRRRQRQAMMGEPARTVLPAAKPKARAVAVAAADPAPATPIMRPRSERLAAMEQRLALAVGGGGD